MQFSNWDGSIFHLFVHSGGGMILSKNTAVY